MSLGPDDRRLEPDEVQIWWRRHDADVSAAEFERACAQLSSEERAKNARIASPGRRREDVFTRAMLRILLGGYLHRPPQALAFTAEPTGRPRLATQPAHDRREPDAGGLVFNVSHSDGLIVCAFGWNRDLGVDVERGAGSVGDLSFLADYLSPSERGEVERFGGVEGRRRRLDYWVLKEAYLKALGCGLGASPASCTFVIAGPDPPELTRGVAEDPHSLEAWTFSLLDLSADHAAAVAYSRRPGEAVRLAVKPFA